MITNGIEFAAAIAAAVAALMSSQTPPPAPPAVQAAAYVATVPVPVDDPYSNAGAVADNGGIPLSVELPPADGADVTWSVGWIISPYTGNLVCVTGAGCEQDPQFTGPETASYNWVTGEVN